MTYRLLSVFAATLLIAACQSAPAPRLGKPVFSGPAFPFQASDIQLTQTTPTSPSDVQSRYHFPTTLHEGMEQWTKDRIALNSGENRLQLEIHEAMVTEEELPVTEGFAGLFKNEQSHRYTAKLKVELVIYTPERHTARAGVESEVSRRITIPESASVSERQQAFNDLIISVLQQIDAELSERIPAHMAPYLN